MSAYWVLYASSLCHLVGGHSSGAIEASVRYRLTLRERVCGRLLSGAISFEVMVLGATELTPWMTCVGMLISVQFFKYFILFMRV